MTKSNRVKQVLIEKDQAQTWLAEKISKSFSTVNACCTNRQQPSLEILNKIADVLSVNVFDLINDKDNHGKN